ncbi:FHA domain-containing protein [Nocardia sp. NPDC055053]
MPEALENPLNSTVDWPLSQPSASACTLVLNLEHGIRREYRLDSCLGTISIGRSDAADITVSADPTVSRLHAAIERIGDCWVIIDDGMSRNGTFVNGELVGGRRTLESGDTLRVGQSVFTFSEGGGCLLEPEVLTTPVLRVSRDSLTDAQYLILEALCQSRATEFAHAYPASNCRIAEDLRLCVSTVKTHMRALFEIFGVADFPQNQKRMFLVDRALESGVLTDRKPVGSDGTPLRPRREHRCR